MNILFNICLFRDGLACSMFKGEIWTAGGGNGKYLDVVEVLTQSTNTWRDGPKLTQSRYYLTMEVLDNNLVVFGGGGVGSEYSLEILKDEAWREEPLQYEHVGHASVSINQSVSKGHVWTSVWTCLPSLIVLLKSM